ncbi:lipopolysaccharide biosynthesis protein [Paraflavitalea sp. CAU 1676]|uniref:lipopolysaccharide biosynthesis protein n=1 Tax=Paraflavitalea sp. CAU 1676 TaxID=3032598 RepID=UPI0023DC3925|nr:lipopolysaccharide biosynthesis protein [Paraflavitalea sp. CAU 1676]MDF2188762.1 lipopolysaccharide biosynthesis protein [Paraflavitalea sp. CAU 1676]
MGQIRKQVLQSSFLSYIGFGIGAINTYLFTKKGLFTPEQYGLTQVIISISQILAPLCTLGMTGFMGRFFPYYYGNLSNKENDMLMVAVLFSGIGALLVFSGCILFEPWVIEQFRKRSSLLVEYYYWVLVFSFFYFCFTLLESYLGTLKKTVLPNFMKETVYRLCVMILIGLYVFEIINFGMFVILFCSVYLINVLIIVVYLSVTRQFYFAIRFSFVTRRFRKNIRAYVSFMYVGVAISNIARQIDTLALAGAKNLHETGVYSLNQFTAAVLQVPYRGLQAIAGPLIAEHWKNNNYAEINRIYQRSSINLFLIGSFLFLNIWLNYDEGLTILRIDADFAAGKTVFLMLALYNVFELGTGANAALLGTSPAWRFEFYSGLALLALSIPLNIIFAKWKGMEGVALASAGTLVIYNLFRLCYIKYRFDMWPFTIKTLYALLLVSGCYFVSWYLFEGMHGVAGILVRSTTFSVLVLAGVAYFRLTPDLFQVVEVVKKRWAQKNKK